MNCRYCEADGSISPSGLQQFFSKEQSMKDVDANYAMDLIRKFEPSPLKDMGRMSLSGIARKTFILPFQIILFKFFICRLAC